MLLDGSNILSESKCESQGHQEQQGRQDHENEILGETSE